MTDAAFDKPDLLFEDSTAPVYELRQRGVAFPLGGFAPGKYSVVCRSCSRRFTGDKRAFACLPCAIAKGLAAAGEVEAARREGEEVGYRKAIADLTESGRRRYGEREKIVIETETRDSGANPVGRA